MTLKNETHLKPFCTTLARLTTLTILTNVTILTTLKTLTTLTTLTALTARILTKMNVQNCDIREVSQCLQNDKNFNRRRGVPNARFGLHFIITRPYQEVLNCMTWFSSGHQVYKLIQSVPSPNFSSWGFFHGFGKSSSLSPL